MCYFMCMYYTRHFSIIMAYTSSQKWGYCMYKALVEHLAMKCINFMSYLTSLLTLHVVLFSLLNTYVLRTSEHQ